MYRTEHRKSALKAQWKVPRNVADIPAYDAAKSRKEESFPGQIADRLVDGENPIRVFREHRGLTQQQLAKTADIARPYLAELEAGKKEGSVSVFKRIAAALKLELDDIAR